MLNFKQNKCANLLSMSVLALLTTAVYAGGDGKVGSKNHWKLHGNIDVNYGMWDCIDSGGAACSSPYKDQQFFGLYEGFENQYNKLYVKGRYMDWGYRIGASTRGKNASSVATDYTYIGYHGWDHRTKGGYTDGFEIRAGYMQSLYGLNSSTPQHALIFARNAFYGGLYGVYNPYGVRVQGNTGAFTYSAVVASTNYTMTGDDDTKKGKDPFYGGRLVYTGGGHNMLWHVGGSVRFGQYDSDKEYDPNWNAEAAVQWNNFLVWGEYQDHKSKINDHTTGSSYTYYKGWYVSAAWLMDGKRGYNMRRATWKRVRPTSRRGAWEIAGTYLKNDKCEDVACADDGWSAAVNWYANRVVKLGVNYYSGDRAWYKQSVYDEGKKDVWWVQLSAAW